jgi:hypothetical protein
LDERAKNGYVRVRVEIPNLKAKNKGLLGKIGGGRKDEAKNAKIEGDFQDQSFTLTVRGDPVKDMDGKTWTLHVRKLVHGIDKLSCHWEVIFFSLFYFFPFLFFLLYYVVFFLLL